MTKTNKESEIWYAEKTTWDDGYMGSDRLPKWIIKRYDESLNKDQREFSELNVVCKVQGSDKDAKRYKDLILNAVNGVE
ncbi:MAG: hypothetical protein Unbinned202contig1002_45 [Prokaryotic dsDNA virus sp.]|nr:MAG: hypothetical protein Unbinned202contig1002_45 [Prokaryotic dsDNA virus sp.]|tara:strand:+ start:19838 stop:20074 length:237 start_codon:yes stop_codon:yes gene_type:complete